MLTVDLGYTEPITWIFVIADVPDYVLGIDFITKNKLAVIPCLKSLLCTKDNISARLLSKTSHHNTPLYLSLRTDENKIPPEAQELLSKYPELTSENVSKSIPHNTQHFIETTGRPISLKPRRLNLKMIEPVKEAINKMLKEGIIRPSSSAWGSPIHVVPKKSGTWRLVGDYRHLNRLTKKDNYPLPYMRDFRNKLGNKTIFSSLDLKDAYFHIPVYKPHIHKTALATPFGLFEYLKMPFGLSGSAQTFQRFVDGVFRNVVTPSGRLPSIFVYLDDILIASENKEDHKEDVETVLKQLAKFGLKISAHKCNFFTDKIEFLGHTITKEGLMPQTCKVEAIRTFPLPKTLKSLRRYIGMINYYHPFIPKLAEILSPVTALLSCPRGVKDTKLEWTETAINAFNKSKTLLSEKTLLNYIKPNLETAIAVDASNDAIAGVLQQREDGVWKPISFFSRKLSTTEKKYSTFSKELLAIFACIKTFRVYVEGTQFHILTDHQPLLKAFPKLTARDLPREERWLEYIALYTKDIRHVRGAENVVADALSRYIEDQQNVSEEINAVYNANTNDNYDSTGKMIITDIIYPKIHAYYPALSAEILQEVLKLDIINLNRMLEDDEYFRLRLFKSFNNVLKSLTEEEIFQILPTYSKLPNESIVEEEVNAVKIECFTENNEFIEALKNDREIIQILNGDIKFSPKLVKINEVYFVKRENKLIPYIPTTLRRKLFSEIHELGHSGGKSSVKLLSSKYVWPRMKRDILQWVKECLACKKAKVTRHNKAKVQQFPASTGKFNEIHLDLVGPLPPNKGFRYLLTIVDRYTRWCEAIPLESIETEAVLDAFIFHWVARYGVPKILVTDRGSQFESNLWNAVMKRFGIDRHRTTAYHPCANGMVERWHRTLKDALRSHADEDGQHWLNKLPHILLSIRNAINKHTEVSPAQSIYGVELSLPSDLVMPYSNEAEKNITEYTKELIQAMRFVPETPVREVRDVDRLDRTLDRATHVLVRNECKKGLQPNYKGPYEVLERHDKFFKLQLPRGEDYVTIDRLKVCYTDEDYMKQCPRRAAIPKEANPLDTVIYRQPQMNREISQKQRKTATRNHAVRARESIGSREITRIPRPSSSSNNNNKQSNLRTNSTEQRETPASKTRLGRTIRMPKRLNDFIISPKYKMGKKS